jgi:hypothetical protein
MESKPIIVSVTAVLTLGAALHAAAQEYVISGDGGLRRWHKITLTVFGPEASEQGTPNPFVDYRMQVAFTHAASGLTYDVPGYFAADGSAADSSGSSGNAWRAHLAPDHTGVWDFVVSFRQGSGVALSDDPLAGSPVAVHDGLRGSFEVLESDKSGRDLRGKGRLAYAGRHHLRFANGEHFLKAGADSPENLLAYDDFDGTPDNGGYRKSWSLHVGDWREGDPTWQGGKGKGLIGALNYLASKGANAFSFLTNSFHGDDGNVFPHARGGEFLRMDCSKLDQWEIVFEHAGRVGLFLHFKTQETENDQEMDSGRLGMERRLYYRELIARFAHHLALNWNLGEEITSPTERIREYARYFHDHDPYRHPIVVHTFPGDKSQVFGPLLGDASTLTGVALQSGPQTVFAETLEWRTASARAGRPWHVSNDEQSPSGAGVLPDANDADHDDIRRDALWGNLMAGGAGVEYYFGYSFPNSDLTCEDFRSRDRMWDQSRVALEFFDKHAVPFQDMESRNDLISGGAAWCFAGAGRYVVYLRFGGSARLDLRGEEGDFLVRWYDPRSGGGLREGSVRTVAGGSERALGDPPGEPSDDWVVLVSLEGGAQLPGDCNQDGRIDVSDAVCVLIALFVDDRVALACGSGTLDDPANAALLDFNGGGERPAVDVADAIGLLAFLFGDGQPHARGTRCEPFPACPDACAR